MDVVSNEEEAGLDKLLVFHIPDDEYMAPP